MSDKPRLLFVAPWFLFPRTTGGRIRTTDILRGLKGGAFDITLASPAPRDFGEHRDSLAGVCDRFVAWETSERGPLWRYLRLQFTFSRLPISVAADRSRQARAVLAAELAQKPDLLVIDFPHTAVLAPDIFEVPSIVFTHNVEAEIFQRHALVASNPVVRGVWRQQFDKMARFERDTLHRFDHVIAVSERDCDYFAKFYGVSGVSVIPTGVDVAYFGAGQEIGRGIEGSQDAAETLVFTGSMDWMANTDGITYFLNDVWPILAEAKPHLRFDIVGRNPPSSLITLAEQQGVSWRFTGLVDDVRPYVHAAQVYVIPLRVGGGTRLKVFEAMAMGCPVVSTSIGVEGLPLQPEAHYLQGDSPEAFAKAVLRLLDDRELRTSLAARAKAYVTEHFDARQATKRFQEICLDVLKQSQGPARPVATGSQSAVKTSLPLY